MAFKNPLTEKLVDFIRGVNIEVIEQPLDADTFIPGIYIEKGRLLVDEEKLLYPGDLLHEAGHIAMIPSHLRQYASDNVENISEIGDPYEVESICWSWAALQALGLPPDVLFHENGYKGHSEQLARNFQMGVYLGSKRIADYGMAYTPQHAQALGAEPFPVMQKWLRD